MHPDITATVVADRLDARRARAAHARFTAPSLAARRRARAGGRRTEPAAPIARQAVDPQLCAC